jgi:hypothetical protein
MMDGLSASWEVRSITAACPVEVDEALGGNPKGTEQEWVGLPVASEDLSQLLERNQISKELRA